MYQPRHPIAAGMGAKAAAGKKKPAKKAAKKSAKKPAAKKSAKAKRKKR
jgi:hypothetical protein